ncbi:AAA family ATPase, partial [Candidatus Dependentiae bacterium]|nr:AAA family ATPase [Candidatus Dependentiae bacterium]
MIHRDVTEFMQSIAPKMPVTCILGPRQAGKTTLIQHCFSSYKYFSCDKETDVALIEADPAAFLHQQLATNPGLIIDEFQYCPRILPAIKNYVDETQSKGRIVLTGSQNYLMMATITQSLAGRVALIDLLPLSINELQQADVLPSNIDALLFQGSYPRLYTPAPPPKNV